MNNKKEPDYFMPALIGGVLAGFISAVPFLNCLCCLWIIAGGILSAYLLSTQKISSFKSGDGLLVGALSGVIGGIVNGLLEIPLSPIYFRITQRFIASLSRFSPQLPPNWQELFQMRPQSWHPSFFILNLLISCLIFGFFGAIGGLIGYSLFVPSKPAGAKNETTPSENQGDHQSSL
ncbi:MAG: hypothetical protein JHC32_04065 [Candidatus Aminicenantes bacterium]|nr:hypothetical protein [Candidatus Aminicenantes bacterium]